MWRRDNQPTSKQSIAKVHPEYSAFMNVLYGIWSVLICFRVILDKLLLIDKLLATGPRFRLNQNQRLHLAQKEISMVLVDTPRLTYHLIKREMYLFTLNYSWCRIMTSSGNVKNSIMYLDINLNSIVWIVDV